MRRGLILSLLVFCIFLAVFIALPFFLFKLKGGGDKILDFKVEYPAEVIELFSRDDLTKDEIDYVDKEVSKSLDNLKTKYKNYLESKGYQVDESDIKFSPRGDLLAKPSKKYLDLLKKRNLTSEEVDYIKKEEARLIREGKRIAGVKE